MRLPRTLGVESSCDETAAAVLDGEGGVESQLLSSQVQIHRRWGGVVPEVASREHLVAIRPVVEAVLDRAGGPPELVAVTDGPGLVGALLVGVRFAAAFAWALDLPLVRVDHLEGHLASPFLFLDGRPARPMPPRVLSLVASGGHSSWYAVEEGAARRLCRTRDDAAGEAFDKLAQVLGLPYPGGPVVDRIARSGDADAVPLPLPRIKANPDDFSFSGLKSAAVRWVRARGLEGAGEGGGQAVADLLASFEKAVVDQLLRPLPGLVKRVRPVVLAVAGGVAANTRLRHSLVAAGEELGVEVLLPPPALTTDNAAMIARAGQLAFARGVRHDVRRVDARGRTAWQPPGMRRAS